MHSSGVVREDIAKSRQTRVGHYNLGGSDNEEAVHVSASKTNLSEEKLIMKKAGIAATLTVVLAEGAQRFVGATGAAASERRQEKKLERLHVYP